MVALSSLGEVLRAVGAARDVDVGAYVLTRGTMVRELELAASCGARVTVTVGRGVRPQALRVANRRAAAELRAAGVRVRFARAPFHVKAAVVDGVAYLDDRNWAGGGCSTVVRDDDAADVAAVRAALRGAPASTATLALRKDAALRREAALVRGAGAEPVVVATESFSAGVVADQVELRAGAGLPTTLVVYAGDVDARESKLLRRLAHEGVQVRLSAAREKYALAGDAAWVGSANATGGAADQVEWGTVSRDPALVASLRERCASPRFGQDFPASALSSSVAMVASGISPSWTQRTVFAPSMITIVG